MTTAVSSKDESVRDKSVKAGRTAKRRAKRPQAPSEDQIRILAYDLYERRRAEGAEGDSISDWVEAERRLQEATGRDFGQSVGAAGGR